MSPLPFSAPKNWSLLHVICVSKIYLIGSKVITSTCGCTCMGFDLETTRYSSSRLQQYTCTYKTRTIRKYNKNYQSISQTAFRRTTGTCHTWQSPTPRIGGFDFVLPLAALYRQGRVGRQSRSLVAPLHCISRFVCLVIFYLAAPTNSAHQEMPRLFDFMAAAYVLSYMGKFVVFFFDLSLPHPIASATGSLWLAGRL